MRAWLARVRAPRRRTPERCDESVEFVLTVEAGILEAQAVLLCESIRRFAGRYARCPITVVSPRRARRPSADTVRRLEQLEADYRALEIESAFPDYGTSYRVHSLAHQERRSGPPIIIQLDSDTIFVAEPDFSLVQCDAAARPVDVKGMCTSGPADPREDYWRRLCELVGVDLDRVPIIQSTVDRVAVRASYNGGLIAARRGCGLFQRTEEFFCRLVAADLRSWKEGPVMDTGTGVLQGAATVYWGTSQAAFSLAAVAGNHAVRILPPSHNFPLHLAAHLATPPLVHIHYHGLFAPCGGAADFAPDGMTGISPEVKEWLGARLPLRPGDEGANVFVR
jgi:hypothetical protein